MGDTNKQVRDTADTLRGKEKTAFEAEETDLTTAIGQLGDAIEALSGIGADQTMASEAHTKFMAGYEDKAGLISLHKTVNTALVAASSMVGPAQLQEVDAFLQRANKAPFSETYVSQSGELFGILKSMKATFESNLEAAKAAEKAAIKTHGDLIITK